MCYFGVQSALSKKDTAQCDYLRGMSVWETAHYRSAKPIICGKWEVSLNVSLGEGYVGSFPET